MPDLSFRFSLWMSNFDLNILGAVHIHVLWTSTNIFRFFLTHLNLIFFEMGAL